MNKLELIRAQRGMTYEALGATIGVVRSMAWEHCKKYAVLPASAAIRYSAALGIPLSELRPDLPEPCLSSPSPPSSSPPERPS